MPNLLLVDTSYQIHRAVHAHPNLSCGGIFTGGIYGFFQILGKAVRETEATHLAFCVDWPPYRRSLVYPDYKLLRKKAQDPAARARVEQTKLLVWGALTAMRQPTYGLQGFEADDFITAIARRQRHRFDMIYASSNDSDLWQHLGQPNFALYKTDIDNLVTLDTLKGMGLTPEQYMLATALQGTHNDIAGIPGVGEVTAQKAVKDAAVLRRLRDAHGPLIERNLRLIQLPHPELPASAGVLQPRPTFNPRQLYAALGRFDIDVSHALVKAFTQTSERT